MLIIQVSRFRVNALHSYICALHIYYRTGMPYIIIISVVDNRHLGAGWCALVPCPGKVRYGLQSGKLRNVNKSYNSHGQRARARVKDQD